MRTARGALCALVSAVLGLLTFVVVAPVAHADTVAAVDADIHISEVFPNGKAGTANPNDFIELTNTGTSPEDVSGWILKDDTDTHAYVIDTGSVIQPGGYLAFAVDDATHAGSFGLGGSGDMARVYDGSALVDQFKWTAAVGAAASFNRCSAGFSTYQLVVLPATSQGSAPSCPDPATVLAGAKAQVKVNEVMADNVTGTDTKQLTDWIELVNNGSTAVNLAGWWLNDNGGTADEDVFSAGTVLSPGAHQAYAVGGTTSTDTVPNVASPWGTSGAKPDFGLGKSGDQAAIVAPDGLDADRLTWTANWGTGKTFGRCNPDGTGAFGLTFTPSPAAANTCANPDDAKIKINEVATGKVELKNVGTSAANVSGWLIKDAAAQTYVIAAATTIPAGGWLTLNVSSAITFNTAGDGATLFDGAAWVDATTWTGALAPSWGRCPDGTGAFVVTHSQTDGASNDCAAPPPSPYSTIRISEVETNGDVLGDWIELTNTGDTAVNISGMYLTDNGVTTAADFATSPTHAWAIPGTNTTPTDTTTVGNTALPAHGYLAFYESNTFPFGLGGPDMANVWTPAKSLIDSTSWAVHEAGVTYARCPGVTQGVAFTDSADAASFINTSAGTPNAANECTPPVRINEVQASDSTGGPDWVELTNVGSQPVDISNWLITDDTDSHGDYVPAGTVLNPGAFVSFEVNSTVAFPTPSVPFGLGASGDEVRIYQAGAWSNNTYVAADLVDSFVFEAPKQSYLTQTVTLPNGTWPAASGKVYTYARCSDGVSRVVADGTGAWAATGQPTRGTANQCDGLFTAQPWPDTHNAQAVATADNVDLGQNMSGLFYQPGLTPADDYMWGVANGSSGLGSANPGDAGSLYKLVADANGKWGPAPGWEKGRGLRFLGGTGEPDSEGVTAAAGKVYVTSERDNTNSDVSKIAVLQVDPNSVTPNAGDVDGDLLAQHEWDLTDLMPPAGGGINPETGLNSSQPGDANLGLEGVSYVPDAYLVGAGFVDEHTGAAYDPSTYLPHEGGVFFVGLEKTGKLYGYVLQDDNTFVRVATVGTGFQTIMDVEWDPAMHALWATCDNSCQGRSSEVAIDPATGKFAVQTVHQRPTGAVDNLNNEGFTVQAASRCVDGTKSAFWSDDSDDGGHWLRTVSIDCTPPAGDAVGATVTTQISGTQLAAGVYAGPVTVSFTCEQLVAVLTAACPAPATVTSTTAGFPVAMLTDTLGLAHTAAVPPLQVLRYYVEGAAYADGQFTMTKGQDYTVVALTDAPAAPQLIGPKQGKATLSGNTQPFTAAGTVDGLYEYTTSAHLTSNNGTWQLGVRVGGSTQVITVHP